MLLPAAASAAQLNVSLQGLRNLRGQVHLCLTRSADHFPDCSGDPAAVKRSLPANQAAHIAFELQPGAYALSVIHDENGNGRLDTSLGIPREGFGFSNNPHIWFGPPSFAAARFLLPAGGAALNVTMKYML
ncbi:MAG: DUF2141 domain-containing protein [Sphingomonadaceae bacterium]|nr:DUF2141 domain-containing protein [Sphingomonadaceae bacterium]